MGNYVIVSLWFASLLASLDFAFLILERTAIKRFKCYIKEKSLSYMNVCDKKQNDCFKGEGFVLCLFVCFRR